MAKKTEHSAIRSFRARERHFKRGKAYGNLNLKRGRCREEGGRAEKGGKQTEKIIIVGSLKREGQRTFQEKIRKRGKTIFVGTEELKGRDSSRGRGNGWNPDQGSAKKPHRP